MKEGDIVKEGFGRIKDIHNIGGYHLTPEEALKVAKMRCKSIGLEVDKFHQGKNKRRQSDIRIDFRCSLCGDLSKDRRYDNIYRGTNKPYCLKCTDGMKGDKSGFLGKGELQNQINDLYENKSFSFKVLNNPDYFHNTSKVDIKCINCGYEDTVILRYLKTGRKSCDCSNSRSDLEFITRIVLETLGSDYESEYRVETENNTSGEKYRFDFAIIEDGEVVKLIECDGIQHFKPTFGKAPFEATKRSDKEKSAYAYDRGIPLLRIKYDELEKNIIKKIIEFIKL